MTPIRRRPPRPKQSRSAPPRRQPHSRLWVERLEDCLVPTAMWVGGGGDWSDPSDCTVGPYKLLEQIGEGGFGVAFMSGDRPQPPRR